MYIALTGMQYAGKILTGKIKEMKKGNVGVVFGILGKKLKDSLGRTIDFGLTGKDGAVHPSLTESAKMFEQNVVLFGSTVESLLYRYGKVLLANTFCKDAFFKNNYWMTQLQKNSPENNDANIKKIAQEVLEKRAYICSHPLERTY